MKKIFLLSMLAVSFGTSAQIFQKGDIVVDLGIGVGAAQVTETKYTSNDIKIDDKSKATFTQKLGFEFGVMNLSDNSSIGVGVNFNNSCGASHQSIISGNYDYSYSVLEYRKGSSQFGNKWDLIDVREENRKGSGSAQATTRIEDFNIMVKVAYHRQFIDNLDTYAAFGFGISSYRNLYSGYSHYEGFSQTDKSFDSSYSNTYQLCYTYNDKAHVKWNKGGASARFVMAAYVGARYYLTENWGINAQLGLTSLSFKKDANNFSIFDIGVSYKF